MDGSTLVHIWAVRVVSADGTRVLDSVSVHGLAAATKWRGLLEARPDVRGHRATVRLVPGGDSR